MKYHTQSGKVAIFALVALVVVAVGALAFLSGKMLNKESEASAPQTAQAAQPQPQINIEPGNPVVAKVNGQDVTRLEVFEFIQTLPPNQRPPIQQLFPIAVDQVVNAKIVDEQAVAANLAEDPQVLERLENSKAQIIRTVFLEKQVEEKMTEKRIKKAYNEYKKNFQKIDQVRARHILVEDEALAGDLIRRLGEGAAFEELAAANSKDGTAAQGGDLGFFAKDAVVPEFAEAAFGLKKGDYTKEPVKTQFGFHIIKLEEKRTTQPDDYETVKPLLQPQLRLTILNEVVEEWREKAEVERFDINGNALEPSAGEE